MKSKPVQPSQTMRLGWRLLVATTFPLPAPHFNEDFPPFVIRHAQPRPGHSPTQSNPVQPMRGRRSAQTVRSGWRQLVATTFPAARRPLDRGCGKAQPQHSARQAPSAPLLLPFVIRHSSFPTPSSTNLYSIRINLSLTSPTCKRSSIIWSKIRQGSCLSFASISASQAYPRNQSIRTICRRAPRGW